MKLLPLLALVVLVFCCNACERHSASELRLVDEKAAESPAQKTADAVVPVQERAEPSPELKFFPKKK